jgi:hypothetical protein
MLHRSLCLQKCSSAPPQVDLVGPGGKHHHPAESVGSQKPLAHILRSRGAPSIGRCMCRGNQQDRTVLVKNMDHQSGVVHR